MRLAEWMEINKVGPADLAPRLRCARFTVDRYARRQSIPKPKMMGRIYVITGGAVRPDDFYVLPELPTKKEKAA